MTKWNGGTFGIMKPELHIFFNLKISTHIGKLDEKKIISKHPKLKRLFLK
jgi:hypothetical protein